MEDGFLVAKAITEHGEVYIGKHHTLLDSGFVDRLLASPERAAESLRTVERSMLAAITNTRPIELPKISKATAVFNYEDRVDGSILVTLTLTGHP